MKTALIKPPASYADWYKYPALNLAYISTYVESHGFECQIFDAYYNCWSEKELLKYVEQYRPDVVGISAMTHEINGAAHIGLQLNERLDAPIIIGGCHVTALPKRTLEEFPAFDYGIYGEGEKTFLELLQSLLKGSNLDLYSVKGLVFRNGRKVILNEPRPFLSFEELDSIPIPNYNCYFGNDHKALAGKDKCYLIFSSRGCPHRCVFCMRVLGNKIRRRSIKNICEEIERAINQYGAHTFDFSDEVFLTDCRHTRELLQLMIDRGYPAKIRWSANTRANYVNPGIIALAKKAGCYRLGMGVESGDDQILKVIGKDITVEQVHRAVKIIKQAGIALGTYFILGHPNETRETVRKTVKLAMKLNTDTIAVGLMVPYPGTKIYDMALRGEGGYRLLTEDWAEYDKYCARALEIEGLPHKELVKWQKKALIGLYLKNMRFLDAIVFFWERKRAFIFLIGKLVARLKSLIFAKEQPA